MLKFICFIAIIGCSPVPAAAPALADAGVAGDVLAITELSAGDAPQDSPITAEAGATADVSPCTPGATVKCASDNAILLCNDTGDLFEQKCSAADGTASQCLATPTPHCAQCVPGIKSCDPTDETKTRKCGNDGVWLPSEQCDTTLGQTCGTGGLCEQACWNKYKPNMCEFWAVELDNAAEMVPQMSKGGIWPSRLLTHLQKCRCKCKSNM